MKSPRTPVPTREHGGHAVPPESAGRRGASQTAQKLQCRAGVPAVSPRLPDAPSGITDRVLRSAGTGLPGGVRAEMEDRFGVGLEKVRIHTGASASAAADATGARAFTCGSHIVFGRGELDAATSAGRHLLAHELAHVVQQTRAPGVAGAGPGEAHERSAEQAAQKVIAGGERVNVEGASAVGIARAPKPGDPKVQPFENMRLMTVDLPLGSDTGACLGYAKDFHGYMPKWVVEDEALWHASHAVGRIVGIELEEGILVAPRGVNLALQKRIENHINRIREGLPEGSRLTLKIETRAHWGTRRLEFINYEIWVSHAERNSERALATSVNVTNDPERPQATIEVSHSPEGSAVRRYPDALNIRSEERAPREGDNQRPLKPRSQAPATYSATSGGIKRHEVPDPVVIQRWQKPPSSGGTGAAGSGQSGTAQPAQPVMSATSTDIKAGPKIIPTPPVLPPPAPRPPAPTQAGPAAVAVKPSIGATPTAGRLFQAPSNALVEQYAKAGTANAFVAVATAAGNLLHNYCTAEQESRALTRFYAKQLEIEKTLDDNPGFGVIIEFVFSRAREDSESVLRPADEFQDIYLQPATSPNDVKSAIYPSQNGHMLHIRRQWIKPRQAAAPVAAAAPAPARPLVTVQNAAQLEVALGVARSQLHLSHSRIFQAFKAAPQSFGSAPRVELGDLQLEVPASVYAEALPKLEQAAIASFTRSFNALAEELRELDASYAKFSSEWWPARQSREFELSPTLLKDAHGSLDVGREWLSKKDFDMARSFLKTGNERARKVRFMLYHYDKGEKHWLEFEE